MSKDFDPNNRSEDIENKGDTIYSDYNTGMENAISSNTENMNDALDQVGVDEKGDVKEGSATDKLIDAQNKNTDFAIDAIEQKQGQAEQDYTKEQAGAYADYQKQIDPYGVQAEQVAASGLSNSGYAESLKTQAYVAYQNRVAVARESFNRIVQDFNNQIEQARLQNNATIAQIITDAMNQRLQIMMEFSVRGTELYTQMVQGGASIKQQNISNYMSVYNQLMQEKQHNEQMAYIEKMNDELSDNQEEWYDKQSWETKVGTMSKMWSNQRDVVSFLQQNGFEVPLGTTPMTREDWNNEKNNGNSSAEYKYSNYTEYLKGYALWYIENSL